MKLGKIGRIEKIVPVIADGAISHPDIKDSHLIPALVVDCTHNTELIDLCLVHQDTPPGDVSTVWTWNLLDKRHVYLRLDFSKPVRTSASIQFDVRRQGGLVCGIMVAHAFYLQPSTFGATVSEGYGNPHILVEVPSHVAPPRWDSIFEEQLVKRYKHSGYDKSQAREAAKQYIQRAKETWSLRPGGKAKSQA